MEESVHVLRFAEARASEIASMMEDVNYRKNKTAYQRVPHHMRRRAASHNPKRVPRKLQESYLVQNPHASTKPKKVPKKQRRRQQKKKHEKQTKNYPEEFASRSRPGAIWLGTHVWHAKRCKMDNLWGYKLPVHCHDKKLGATHQAATKHAMLQDISYYCCIELQGAEEELIRTLSCLTDPDTGSHFGSEMYLDGSREGHAFLYHPHSFPYQGIGPVTFIFRPVLSNSTVQGSIRKLWVWCHPSFHDELVEVLIDIFHLVELIKAEAHTTSSTLNSKEDECREEKSPVVEDEVVFASKINFEKTKQHFRNEKIYTRGDLKMSLLKDRLVRHRLVGPNAQSVMVNVLQLASVEAIASKTEDELSGVANKPNGDFVKSQIIPEVVVDACFNGESRKHKLDLDDTEICSISKKIKLDDIGLHNNGESLEPAMDKEDSEMNNCMKKSNSIGEEATNTESASISVMDKSCNSKDINEISIKEKITLDSVKKEGELDSTKCETFKSKLWWQSYFESENAKISHLNGKKLLGCLRNGRSNYYIPPNSVFGVTVRDPRLILSRNKEKFTLDEGSSDMGKCIEDLLTANIADSPLWENHIRNEMTATQISEDEINKERAKYVISSESLNLGNKESRVPILLIHQSGINGFCSGWDLIAPLGWSMAFWIPLILNGGRAAGLRDLHFVNLETGQPSFPLSYPDTDAGSIYEEKLRVDELTTYHRRPKAKRPNFCTFGVPNPFHMPWKVLVGDWETELKNEQGSLLLHPATSSSDVFCNSSALDSCNDKGFFVLRQKEIRQLQNLCERLSRLSKRNLQELENLRQVFNNLVLSIFNSQRPLAKSLVLIRTKCLTRGCPTIHSGIYMPNDSDIKEMVNNPNYLGPSEPKRSRFESQTFRCSSEKKDSSGDKTEDKSSVKIGVTEGSSGDKSSSNNQINSKDFERPDILSLKSCSSRKMIGYLSEGGFSSIMGKGCGIGHCTLLGLLFLLKTCISSQIRPLVLIREQHSFQYRVSSVEIIQNYL